MRSQGLENDPNSNAVCTVEIDDEHVILTLDYAPLKRETTGKYREVKVKYYKC